MNEVELRSSVLYYGCLRESGHYMFSEGGRSVRREEKELLPAALRIPDGTFCRGVVRTRTGSFESTLPQIEGLARLALVEGWTVMAFWDRSVDSRPGSNSCFMVYGRHSFADMERMAKNHWPEIWARFKFEVTLEGADAESSKLCWKCPEDPDWAIEMRGHRHVTCKRHVEDLLTSLGGGSVTPLLKVSPP